MSVPWSPKAEIQPYLGLTKKKRKLEGITTPQFPSSLVTIQT